MRHRLLQRKLPSVPVPHRKRPPARHFHTRSYLVASRFPTILVIDEQTMGWRPRRRCSGDCGVHQTDTSNPDWFTRRLTGSANRGETATIMICSSRRSRAAMAASTASKPWSKAASRSTSSERCRRDHSSIHRFTAFHRNAQSLVAEAQTAGVAFGLRSASARRKNVRLAGRSASRRTK